MINLNLNTNNFLIILIFIVIVAIIFVVDGAIKIALIVSLLAIITYFWWTKYENMTMKDVENKLKQMNSQTSLKDLPPQQPKIAAITETGEVQDEVLDEQSNNISNDVISNDVISNDMPNNGTLKDKQNTDFRPHDGYYHPKDAGAINQVINGERWMENEKYTSCYKPPSYELNNCNTGAYLPFDEANTRMAKLRQRDKKALDGWTSKSANYYRKHYSRELHEAENERWWGNDEY
jgi:Ca2+/Na+ antiporter